MKAMQARRAALLVHIASRVKAAALELGLAEDRADHIGAAAADCIAEDFGGEVISFPKDEAYRLSKREQAILEDRARGLTLLELARRYSMTQRGLYKLIARVKSRTPVSIEQPTLF